MPNTFFISDTHFNHRKIVEGFGDNSDHATLDPEAVPRPFANIQEHDEALVENWNSVVRDQDVVWHLGDVVMGNGNAGPPMNFDILARLNGKKKLILGNHDGPGKIAEYAKHFDKMLAYHVVGKSIICSHIPVHVTQVEHRFVLNIHGHVHSATLDDDRYLNVSCEAIDYTPIALEDIKKIARERGLF